MRFPFLRPKPMALVNIVTAVSRQYNLPKILASLENAIGNYGIEVRWIMVFDYPLDLAPSVKKALVSKRIKLDFIVYHGGKFKFGVKQKNYGIDQIKEGWYYLLDDDNVIHPNFFKSLSQAIKENPGKKCFVFSQHRTDSEDKIAAPDRMEAAMIDNSMFLTHMDLIGKERYEPGRAGIEDFWFFRGLYDKAPEQFVFLNEFLAFYNYLNQFPDAFGGPMGADKIVVTMGDANFKPLTDLTFPMIEAYAAKVGADFKVLRERRYPNVNICYEKFQMRDLLDTYRRVLYVDGDVLIRPRAQNVFEAVPFGHFSAMNEHDHIHFWDEQKIAQQFAPYDWQGPWNGRHFNAGVLVFDQSHKRLFENPVIANVPYWDQPYLNVSIDRMNIPYFALPPEYNFMIFHPYRNPGDLHQRAHFIHFSGTTMSPKEKAEHLKKELLR